MPNKKPPEKVLYQWNPKEDITTYELAQAMTMIIHSSSAPALAKVWDRLPDSVKRHFEVIAIDA